MQSPDELNTLELNALKMQLIARLAPGLRHKLLGKLQPLSLLSQLLSKKITANAADLHDILTQVNDIKHHSRLLTTEVQDLFDWLMAPAEAVSLLQTVLDESIDLLKMECYSRHLTITSHTAFESSADSLLSDSRLSETLQPETSQPEHKVPQSLARIVICSSLLSFIDQSTAPRTLQIVQRTASLDFHLEQAEIDESMRADSVFSAWAWVNAVPSSAYQLRKHARGAIISF